MNVDDLIRAEAKRIGIVLDSYGGPSKWRCLVDGARNGGDGQSWQLMGLRVIWSLAIELDARPWLHVSASREARLPSYSDMTLVKRLFVGPRHVAYSVWPSVDDHVNIHANVLHLWAPRDDEPLPLPDFTRGRNTI